MAGRSIISMPAGMMPAAMTARDACAGAFDVGKADEQRAREFGLGQDAHGDFGDDAEQAFRADDEAQQIIDRR